MLDKLTLQESAIDFKEFCAGKLTENSTIFQDCNLDENFIGQSLMIFNLATGGFLPLLFWGIICFSIYLKYRNFTLTGCVAIVALVTSTIWIDDMIMTFILLMLAVGIATTVIILIWKVPRD